jgi:hypothetical protein
MADNRKQGRSVRFEVSTAVTMMIIIFWEMIIIKEEVFPLVKVILHHVIVLSVAEHVQFLSLFKPITSNREWKLMYPGNKYNFLELSERLLSLSEEFGEHLSALQQRVHTDVGRELHVMYSVKT